MMIKSKIIINQNKMNENKLNNKFNNEIKGNNIRNQYNLYENSL